MHSTRRMNVIPKDEIGEPRHASVYRGAVGMEDAFSRWRVSVSIAIEAGIEHITGGRGYRILGRAQSCEQVESREYERCGRKPLITPLDSVKPRIEFCIERVREYTRRGQNDRFIATGLRISTHGRQGCQIRYVGDH